MIANWGAIKVAQRNCAGCRGKLRAACVRPPARPRTPAHTRAHPPPASLHRRTVHVLWHSSAPIQYQSSLLIVHHAYTCVGSPVPNPGLPWCTCSTHLTLPARPAQRALTRVSKRTVSSNECHAMLPRSGPITLLPLLQLLYTPPCTLMHPRTPPPSAAPCPQRYSAGGRSPPRRMTSGSVSATHRVLMVILSVLSTCLK